MISLKPDLTVKLCLDLLMRDLNFKGANTRYATHGIHSFAAKFPPQLPRLFIQELTQPGDIILDPMVGSGTTLVECLLLRRRGIGVDIDPLAVMISQCKITKLNKDTLIKAAYLVCRKAYLKSARHSPLLGVPRKEIWNELITKFDSKTLEFIKFWFRPQTAIELSYITEAIEEEKFDENIKTALKVALSAIIVTKSGGVSLARDLAHSRPHRDISKKIPNAIQAFKRKVEAIARGISSLPTYKTEIEVMKGDARRLSLDAETVDLIITSPPYAIAIDYVRAHKFSLIWLGYPLSELARNRIKYIGTEKRHKIIHKTGVPEIDEFILNLVDIDRRRGSMVAKYFSDMQLVMTEMYRVLKPGRLAIIVVGPSTVRGTMVPTHEMLMKMGQYVGFRLVGYTSRLLDRNKRYLPVSTESNNRGIEARIHKEYVIAFMKQ